MVNNNKDTLSIIKNSVSALLPGCRVLLFGSRAKNEESPESDYDFLVITKNNIDISRKRFYKALLRKELARHKIPADILIQSEEEIEIKKEITGHIVKEIVNRGVII